MSITHANHFWLRNIKTILDEGLVQKARNTYTTEILGYSGVVDMNYPFVGIPSRKLNYQFMIAEALNIINGDVSVKGIIPYNSKMAEYSDDGIWLRSAYGTRVMEQLDYVVECLASDPTARYSVMDIWRENPRSLKNVPCTLAYSFLRRCHMDTKSNTNKLNMFVNMRSSDAWLGLPYDIAAAAIVACLVACRLNAVVEEDIVLGNLYFSTNSSHIYNNSHLDSALKLYNNYPQEELSSVQVPKSFYTNETSLREELADLVDCKSSVILRSLGGTE